MPRQPQEISPSRFLRKLGSELLLLLLAATIPGRATNLYVSTSGVFGSAVTADSMADPGEAWALSFDVDSNPVAENPDSLGFDAPFSDFTYFLNGTTLAVTPQAIRFFTSDNGGLFTVYFGPESGFVNGQPIPEFSFSGDAVFSGSTLSPMILAGIYPISDVTYSDAQNYDDEGPAGGVSIAAQGTTVPEPSTATECSIVIALGLLLNAARAGRFRSPTLTLFFRHERPQTLPSLKIVGTTLVVIFLSSSANGYSTTQNAQNPWRFGDNAWFSSPAEAATYYIAQTESNAPQYPLVLLGFQGPYYNYGSLGCSQSNPCFQADVAYVMFYPQSGAITVQYLGAAPYGQVCADGSYVGAGQACVGKSRGTGCNCVGSSRAGNPIDVGSGNKFEEVTDYQTTGQNPFRFTRYYNSLSSALTPAASLGMSWRSSYDRYIRPVSATSAIAERADGQQLLFTLAEGVWSSDTDVDVTLSKSGATWTLTDLDDTVETYTTNSTNTVAALNTIQARNGYTQTLSYSNNQLTLVSDSYGRILSLSYSGGLVNTLSTPDGTSIAFGYTSAGSGSNLTSVTYSTSPPSKIAYVYGNSALPNSLTGIIDENGNTYASWTYDAYGRGLTSVHGGSGLSADLTTITYNDSDGSRTVTNAEGVTDTYSFTILQTIPKKTQISRAATTTTAAATQTFTYDSNGYLASQSDWNGNQTAYTNNSHGLPTMIVEAAGSPVVRTTTIAYDATFVHLPDSIITAGLTTSFTYDVSGNVLTRTLTDTTTTSAPYSTNGQTRTWTNTWSNFLLTSSKTPNGNTTTFGYDGSGALVSVSDALGHTTTITAHTGGGLPQTIVDPNSVTTTMTYDLRQRLLSSSVSTGAGARTTAYTYDAAGNLTKTTQPDGSALTNAYDAAHRLTTITDLFHQNVAYTLDALGDRTRTNLTAVGNRVQRQHTDTFDALGRVLTDTGGAGQSTRYTYDPNGNTLTVTDPLGRVTSQAFDALNRLSAVTDPASGITKTTYDAHDRVLSLTDPNGNATTYVYDGFGDLIQQLSPDSGQTVYHYDADGNLTSKTDASGNVTNNTYDTLDRILTTTYPADSTLNIAYAYDQGGHGFGVGRLTSLTDAAGTLSRSYDERANLLSETRVNGITTLQTTYTYDPANRVASTTYPSGWTVSQTRDIMGRIYQLPVAAPGGASSGNAIANATYVPFGPLYTLSFGNGINEARRFDLDYRVTSLTDTGTAALQSLTYAYDANDNVSSITDGVTPAYSQTLGYDVLNRLTSASGVYGSLAYTYDPVGNRRTQTLAGAATTYSYTLGTNRLAGITTGGTMTPVSTTAAGSISGIPPTTGAPVATLIYSAANRLASVGGTTPAIAGILYDAFGRRLSKVDTGSYPILYTYNQGGNLLEEKDGHGLLVDYIYLNGRPAAEITGGKLYYLHADRLGAPQLATDSSQNVVWSTTYQPFGTTPIPIGSITQNLRFPGQYFDGETGFSYNLNRDYIPSLGRYIESDPIGLDGGLETYAYVEQNPLRFTDPSGKSIGAIVVIAALGVFFYEVVNEYKQLDEAQAAARHRVTEALNGSGPTDDFQANANADVGGIPRIKAAGRVLPAAQNVLEICSPLSLASDGGVVQHLNDLRNTQEVLSGYVSSTKNAGSRQ